MQSWENKQQQKIGFVLQVGDFEPHRNEKDLQTMDAPNKYKKLGEFSQFYEGKVVFPYPLYFIGGNHEPYGFLDLYPLGKEIAPNFHYLGRVSCLDLHRLRIVGVSGIYREQSFAVRPPIAEIDRESNKEYIGFTEAEIQQALSYKDVDILIMHQWADIICEDESIGNEYASLLIKTLQPKLVLFGHMHQKYQTTLKMRRQIEICCLANVQQGKDAIAVFKVDKEQIIPNYFFEK